MRIFMDLYPPFRLRQGIGMLHGQAYTHKKEATRTERTYTDEVVYTHGGSCGKPDIGRYSVPVNS